MHWIDWLIISLPLVIVFFITWRTHRYVRSVSDFLVASRVAGRYVVAVAGYQAENGLISAVALFELYTKSGFAVSFWNMIATPILLVVLLTGFAIYRYRETRAMTLAQFLEIRYSKRFRVFAGILQSISGIVNYGLFPAVGARFIIYYCNLPSHLELFGRQFPTIVPVMAFFLGIAVFVVTRGGQITMMTIDCVQGILSYPMFLAVVVAVLFLFSWHGQMEPALSDRPPGESMLNPFDTIKLQDFNLFYVVVGIIGSVYSILSWSGTAGFNAAALTPHEQQMGRILGVWRGGFSAMAFVMLAVAAYTYFHDAGFAKDASATQMRLAWKTLDDVAPQKSGEAQLEATDKVIAARVAALDPKQLQVYEAVRNQMMVPVALRDILPIGISGTLCALMMFLMMSCDASSLHSWGSIIVQDVLLPFRKEPFTPRQQLLILRLSITGLAVFAFFFSLCFGQVTYILMFFALTGSIWLGGAGAVILGGLYWNKGTTAGAWAALTTGSLLALLGFVCQQYWVSLIYPLLAIFPALLKSFTWCVEGFSHRFEPIIFWRVTPEKFPINGQEIYLLTIVLSVGAYVFVSWLTCWENFDMDRMLHRGKYGPDTEHQVKHNPTRRRVWSTIQSLVGIDEQFTRGDKILSWTVFAYSMGWSFGSWCIILLWNAIHPWPAYWWSNWFYISNVVVTGIIGVISTVWYSIGGTWDLRRMYQRLAAKQRNVLDDGRVVQHVNAEDIASIPETSLDQHPPDEQSLELRLQEAKLSQ